MERNVIAKIPIKVTQIGTVKYDLRIKTSPKNNKILAANKRAIITPAPLNKLPFINLKDLWIGNRMSLASP